MKVALRSPQSGFAVLLALTITLLALTPAAADAPATIVNGGGTATITDPDGNEYPLTFGVAGLVADNGSAQGHITFVFQGAFAQAWGALPGVESIHLTGEVTEGSVAPDGTVTLEGSVTEVDYTHGQGVVFRVENDPFQIVTGGPLGTHAFTLQWCLLPVFQVESHSELQIHQLSAQTYSGTSLEMGQGTTYLVSGSSCR